MNSSTAHKQIIFVDSSVQNYQNLIEGADANAKIVILDNKRSGIEQITQALASERGIEAVHILSHGSPGSLKLGADTLNDKEIKTFSTQIKQWGNALTENGDIQLYGCDVAAGETGIKFVKELSELTLADVAASNNITGNAELGGDWNLEVKTGKIQALLPLGPLAMTNYQGILGLTFIKDINPGATHSSPENFFNFNNTLYFIARDDTNGSELWKSDGTASGTELVKDINPGATASYPGSFINFNNTLYFSADNGTNGRELWKSDGTAFGTELVKDIWPGGIGSSPGSFINFNNTLYFSANNGTNGNEWWKSDGTASGTVLVKDINLGSNTSASDPGSFINFNNTLYFSANNGTNGDELWKSDGTASGTELVKDINPGGSNSNPYRLINFNNTLYFSATDATNGRELWKSDGTA
ncbi:DUF4347 domain-containing protein, partial [Microcoleus sp. Pol11C2]|uniref:ELWxxDGT repeat protein n=1 Tax=Microcoleus sp. Pol11C2 TaxID=3055389 RepID=UPI002FD38EA5